MTVYFVRDLETGEQLGPDFETRTEAEEEARAWRKVGSLCETAEA